MSSRRASDAAYKCDDECREKGGCSGHCAETPDRDAASERPWCPSGEPAAWGLTVGSRMTEYGGTKRVEVSSIRDGYVYVRDLPEERPAATCSTCGGRLFWNAACDQYQHEEEWRNRDHSPACEYNNSDASMADARLRSMGRA